MMHEIDNEECGDIEEPLMHKDGTDKTMKGGELKELSRFFCLFGCLFGSWFQMVSLSATALLAKWFGEVPVLQTYEDKFSFYILFGLSNTWLLLFPIICLAMERSWTKGGNRCLHQYFLHQFSCKQLSQRTNVVLASQFLMGIVIGSFATWGCVDLYIGTSTLMFGTLIACMMACTALCYTMVLVYDMCVDEDEDDN